MLEILLVLFICFAFLIRTANFQTFLAKQATDYLTNLMNSNVSIGRVDLASIDRAFINEVYVEDQHKDTLFYIQEMYVSFNPSDLINKNFKFDNLKLTNAKTYLKRYEGENYLNLKFFADALGLNKKRDKKVDFRIDVEHFEVLESHFGYTNENRKDDFLPYGVDFMNVLLHDVNVIADNVVILPRTYKADFTRIAFKEKSGLELREYKGKAIFSNKGLKVGKTYMETANSDVYLNELFLISDSLKDFSDFVNLVEVKGQLDKSMVSLLDISYFAPELEGMSDLLLVSGNTSNVINSLEINNLDLSYGNGTAIAGNFLLPDFSKLSKENINQKIDFLAVNSSDLKQFKLPSKDGIIHKITWPKSLEDIHQISATNIEIEGFFDNLNVRLPHVSTNLGDFKFKESLKVETDTTFSVIKIVPAVIKRDLVEIENFEVGKFAGTHQVGEINGILGFNQAIIGDEINVNGIDGVFRKTYLFENNYENIVLEDVDYQFYKERGVSQNYINGKVFVRDENLDLTYNGRFGVGNTLFFNADIDIECAMLEYIHPSLENRGELIGSMKLTATGKNFNDFISELYIDSIYYEEDGKVFETQNFEAFVEHTGKNDCININSDVLDVNIEGKVDYSSVLASIQNQLAQPLPLISKKENVNKEITEFKYDINIKKVNDLLDIFYPALNVAENTKISGLYDSNKDRIDLKVIADYIKIKDYELKDIYAVQEIQGNTLMLVINAEYFYISDSLAYENIHFTGISSSGNFDSHILFFDNNLQKSSISWNTKLYQQGNFDLKMYPSELIVFGERWDIHRDGEVRYIDSTLVVEDFRMKSKEQSIVSYGKLSNSPDDRLNVEINSLAIEEFSSLLSSERNFAGTLDLKGYITTPISNFQFYGDAKVGDFYVNNTEVGTIAFNTDFDRASNRVNLLGDLMFRGNKTFKFDGNYNLNEVNKDSILDFDLRFNGTDISVASEFLNPDVVSKLQGKLNGNLSLTGSFAKPLVTGVIDFDDGVFNLAILGSDIFFDGEIISMQDGFYINMMPIHDKEGNTGFINGSLDHRNFSNFFFEISVNLEDHPFERMPNDRSRPLPVERFLVMDTKYDIDVPYYGTGYITGMANISGYSDNLAIELNAKTRRGTKFVLPMYGPTTIEEDGFIRFKKEKQDTIEFIENKVDLTGIDLRLNFEVTDDAEVKIVFDEKIGDELAGKGTGNIFLTLDQFNEVTMDGVFEVSDGYYNFVLGPYTQKFVINPGGTIQWSGDPYDAILDISAYYKTMANLSVVMPDILDGQKSNNEEIFSYLNITGELSKPMISFDIDAPRAKESGKAIINRIRSDKDELNQQFFSIIISKSFMPLSGQGGLANQSRGAFLDLASSQINNLLNRFTDGYNMNVNLENDEFSGQFSGEFGLSKAFLDDRLFVSGSFGVGTRKVDGGEENVPNQNTFIGDVRVEYLLNQSGTFRMNVFNESNNNYFITQDEGRGQFTQGIGLSYSEDFHNLRDFKLFQLIANVFRKRENWVPINENKQDKIPVPESAYNKYGVLQEK